MLLVKADPRQNPNLSSPDLILESEVEGGEPRNNDESVKLTCSDWINMTREEIVLHAEKLCEEASTPEVTSKPVASVLVTSTPDLPSKSGCFAADLASELVSLELEAAWADIEDNFETESTKKNGRRES